MQGKESPDRLDPFALHYHVFSATGSNVPLKRTCIRNSNRYFLQGIERVMKAHPMVRIIVGEVDRGLNAKKYIVPGKPLQGHLAQKRRPPPRTLQ